MYSRIISTNVKKLLSHVALITAFGLGMANSAALAASCENPDALTFAIIPTEESVAELQLYKPV